MHELYGKTKSDKVVCWLADSSKIKLDMSKLAVVVGIHTIIISVVANNCMDMDKALSATLDLEMRGLLKDYRLTSEFGRTPRLTRDGRDHSYTGSQPSSLVEELRVELSTVKWIKLAEILRKENLLTRLF